MDRCEFCDASFLPWSVPLFVVVVVVVVWSSSLSSEDESARSQVWARCIPRQALHSSGNIFCGWFVLCVFDEEGIGLLRLLGFGTLISLGGGGWKVGFTGTEDGSTPCGNPGRAKANNLLNKRWHFLSTSSSMGQPSVSYNIQSSYGSKRIRKSWANFVNGLLSTPWTNIAPESPILLLCTLPPMRSRASNIFTLWPRCFNSRAAANPDNPAPTMMIVLRPPDMLFYYDSSGVSWTYLIDLTRSLQPHRSGSGLKELYHLPLKWHCNGVHERYMNGVVCGSIVFPSFSVLNRLSSAETLIDLKRLLALRWKRKDTTGEPNIRANFRFSRKSRAFDRELLAKLKQTPKTIKPVNSTNVCILYKELYALH